MSLMINFQEEDIGILLLNKIAVWVCDSGSGQTGLDRWCWINLKGNNRHYLKIVSAYQHCGNYSTPSGVLSNVNKEQQSSYRARGVITDL